MNELVRIERISGHSETPDGWSGMRYSNSPGMRLLDEAETDHVGADRYEQTG